MIDENIYLKHRTICKKSHNENRRKTIIISQPKTRLLLQPNNQKSIKLTTTIFQNMKIVLMSLLAEETLVKPITCSKC